jgi:dihydropteroate synthase
MSRFKNISPIRPPPFLPRFNRQRLIRGATRFPRQSSRSTTRVNRHKFLSVIAMPLIQPAPPVPTVPCWAGLSLDRPRIMGILNVTPDSFSDGGRRIDPHTAIDAGVAMAEDGADIVDVGGESTRPGAVPVPPALEQERVVPVIAALVRQGIRVSVDTRNASTMRAALDAGARIVNDVSGLAYDPLSAALVARFGCPVVLMHMRGTPETMGDLSVYQDVVAEVRSELADRTQMAIQAGIRPEQIVVDPGIGFAKGAEQAPTLLRGLPALSTLGYPIMVGVSRKRFIGSLTGEARAGQRLGGSLAAGLFAISQGASILRVHDVRETAQALVVWHALLE